MSNAGVRATRLRTLVRDERRTIASLLNRINVRLQTAEALVTQLESDRAMFEKRLAQFDERLEQLDEWKDEPVVLVRQSAGGYGLPVYHDAKDPCGYMWKRSHFKPMLLAEAEDAGHGPCTACGWRARRRRDVEVAA